MACAQSKHRGRIFYMTVCHKERWTCVPCGDKMTLMLCSFASALRNLPIVPCASLQPVFARGLANLCRVFSRFYLHSRQSVRQWAALEGRDVFCGLADCTYEKRFVVVTTNLCFFLVGHQGLEPRTN